jgi:2-amino-4-hydroxy-6-hydroxymethyldihydropteridine diphosphokinase
VVTGPLVVGLGGNVGGEPAIRARFAAAREALEGWAGGAVRSAALYRSAPIGPAQPAFLNTAVALGDMDAPPDEVLATLRALEARLGRDRAREVRWGPRTLDLDVLVWGRRALRTPALEVPHARLGERRFALAPLVDLVGEGFVVPGLGEAGLALRAVEAQACAQIAARW